MRQKKNRKLRNARNERCWSLAEAANEVGVSVQTYFRWEHGQQKPHPNSRRLLCKAFGVNNPKELGF